MIMATRPALAAMPPAIHGAIRPAELAQWGLGPNDIIDFSVSGNPFGPSPAVRRALAMVPLDRYPDPDALAFRRTVAEQTRRPLAQIIAGNGVSELLWLIALAFLGLESRVLVVGPTYGEYARVAALMGATMQHWTASAEQQFAIQPEAIARALHQFRPTVLFLCHPNNPTGQIFPLQALVQWAAAHPATLFVVDESYLSFVLDAPTALELVADNILVLRSLTKAQALAGLRLGYAIGHEDVVAALRRVQPPWSVNALAQAAGVAALRDQAHTERSLANLVGIRQAFVRELAAGGRAPLPTSTHFFLLPVENASACRRKLLSQGLVVRDCRSFGLPRHIRIATRKPEENARLAAALLNLVNTRYPTPDTHYPHG
jgi:histidinol-phosphate aminotransferase